MSNILHIPCFQEHFHAILCEALLVLGVELAPDCWSICSLRDGVNCCLNLSLLFCVLHRVLFPPPPPIPFYFSSEICLLLLFSNHQFQFDLFEWKRNKETDSSHFLVLFLNACDGWDWARLKLRTRSLTLVSREGARNPVP